MATSAATAPPLLLSAKRVQTLSSRSIQRRETFRSRFLYEAPFVWPAPTKEEDKGGALRRQSQQGEQSGVERRARRLFLLLLGVRVEDGGQRTAGASAAAVAVAFLSAAATAVADHAADEVDGNGEDDGGIFLGGDGAQGLKRFER